MDEAYLDIRSVPLSLRYTDVFAAFDALSPSGTLTVVTDDEPRCLRTELESRHPEAHCLQRRLGNHRWEMRLIRSEAPDGISPVSAALLKSRLLQGLGDHVLEEAAYRARRVAIKRNHVIAEEDVSWPYLGIVERGLVRATLATALGHEHAVYEVLPGDVFGELAVLDGGQTMLRFVAEAQDCSIVLLPLDFLSPIMDRHRSVEKVLSMIAAQHIRAALSHFESLVSQTTTARVARVLLSYASPAEGLCEALAPLPSLTQVELAMRAGTVKEVVSRALAKLEHEGALRRRGGHVAALDRRRLVEATKAAS